MGNGGKTSISKSSSLTIFLDYMSYEIYDSIEKEAFFPT
jgi:hypothetical protein